jgi:ABC-2 type transport system ATP-binding protein
MTIILTTHYIEEAEEMADRVGVIHKGKLILAQEKAALMSKLGKKQLTLQLSSPLSALPRELADLGMTLKADGTELEYTLESNDQSIPALLARVTGLGIGFKDIQTQKSSLEEIFVRLVSEQSSSRLPPPNLPGPPQASPVQGARAQNGAPQ